MLVYLPEVGLGVAHEIHSFFEDEHNHTVIAQLRERGVELQEEGELHPKFAACATLAGLIDKLNIPFIASTGAKRLADRFGSLDALLPPTGSTCARSNASPKKVARSLRDYFDKPENATGARTIEAQLREFGMHWQSERKEAAGRPLAGQAWVLTGTLETMSRDEGKTPPRSPRRQGCGFRISQNQLRGGGAGCWLEADQG